MGELPQSAHSQFIETSVLRVLEANDAVAKLIIDLIIRLVADIIVNVADVKDAFGRVLPQIPDVSLDSPNAPKRFAQLLARGIQSKMLHADILGDDFFGELDWYDRSRIVIETLVILHGDDAAFLKVFLASHDLNVLTLLGDDADDLLNKAKLTSLIAVDATPYALLCWK